MKPLLILLLAPALLLAGPVRTHMVGALYHPTGAIPVRAKIIVVPSKPMTVIDANGNPATTYTIGNVDQTITVTNTAAVDFYLVPNADAVPAGTYYKVRILTDLGEFRQKWEIPNTTSDTRISDVVVTDAPTESVAHLVKTGDTASGTITFSAALAVLLVPQSDDPPVHPAGGLYYQTGVGLRVADGVSWSTVNVTPSTP